ncbi:MAG TPA: hypothetical protein VN702_14580, partial [Acetobacteraceae bacterium]|nr:hypothetical protein [Acetobacteraceae bacterium]
MRKTPSAATEPVAEPQHAAKPAVQASAKGPSDAALPAAAAPNGSHPAPSAAPAVTEAAAAPDAALAPSIDIQLDHAVTAGLMRGRHDIVIDGIVVAAQPVDSVSLIAGQDVVALALYGRSAKTRQMFRLGLASRNGFAGQPARFQIEARTRDGQVQQASFAVAADADSLDSARVVEGPVCDIPNAAKAFTPVLLYVESAAIDPAGVLRVEGWSVALRQIVAIQIFHGADRLGAARFGAARDDIAAAYPDYPNARRSGFSFSKALAEPDAPESVAVEVIDLDGAACRIVVPVIRDTALPQARPAAAPPPTPVQAEPAADPRRAIFCHCDEARLTTDGALVVSGWAVCATGVARIGVALDGEAVGSTE